MTGSYNSRISPQKLLCCRF